MAEGFLQKPKENKQPKDLDHEYFRDLLLRSIFQQSCWWYISFGKTIISKSSISSEQLSWKPYLSFYALHDLVSDLAQWASGETCFSLDDNSGANRQRSNLEKARHFSYVRGDYDGKSKFEVFSKVDQQVKYLRTFLPISKKESTSRRFPDDIYYMSHAVLFDLIPKFKKLRVLNLNNYYITELPRSFYHLKYLRYLDLSYTMIRSLPEFTSSFYNLQILKLRNCSHLRKLPSKMRNLINLCHLDIRGTRLLEMPLGMRELKCLRHLTNFIVGKGSGAEVKDLRHLQFLHGKLCISRLNNVMDLQESEGKILKDMKNIKVLQLEWELECDDTRNYVVEKRALNMLQPHRNLEELTIKCYSGIEFPSWLGNSVFSNMTVLRLENCEKCTSLPSFGRLDSLKELNIKGMKGIKCIGYELYGEGCSKPFQSLEIFRFEDLQEWELWEPIKENEHVETFPHLRELSIVKCPKLFGKLPDDLSSLQTLVIKECAELVVSFSSLPVLCELKIDGCDKIACNGQVTFKSLQSMTLSSLSDYGKWFSQGFEKDICVEKAPQQLQSFTLLSELRLENCSNLISFHEVCYLSKLTKLEIINCNALASLPEGMKHNNAHLLQLMIRQCSSLTFIIKGQPPPSLSEIEVKNCERLECLFDDKDESRTTKMKLECLVEGEPRMFKISPLGVQSPLYHITIVRCSQLTTIFSSGQLPKRLSWLDILTAPKLESIAERFHDNMNLEIIVISNCDNLKYIPEGLDNLRRLEHFSLRDCPNIVCFPEGGLPNTNLSVSIIACEKLEALPNGFHCLDSLRKLRIHGCSSIKSFTEKGFPTNLTSLEIGNHNMHKALVEWGLHKLSSLTRLWIVGYLDAESFPQEVLGMQLPPTLTDLTILEFPNLKYLLSKDFQNLTCLESLWIYGCPILTSFPKQGLPSSLLKLQIDRCPLLKEECKRNKGKEWSKISHIPCVTIDGRFIYDLEEED